MAKNEDCEFLKFYGYCNRGHTFAQIGSNLDQILLTWLQTKLQRNFESFDFFWFYPNLSPKNQWFRDFFVKNWHGIRKNQNFQERLCNFVWKSYKDYLVQISANLSKNCDPRSNLHEIWVNCNVSLVGLQLSMTLYALNVSAFHWIA